MHKRILLGCICIAALLCGLWAYSRAKSDAPQTVPKQNETAEAAQNSGELRAVWVNYNELSMKTYENGGTENDFRAKAMKMCENIRADGLNTVIVQVRPFCDAFYPSKYFPWSAYLTGTQGQAVEYDPLAVFIDCAQAQNLSVQAWINPYRVLPSTEWALLSADNPARKWYEAGKTENLLLTGEGIYLNPASTEVQTLLLNGVREILENYAVSAIHLDDYFYPTTDYAVDAGSFAAYLAAGGTLSQDDWRRENVSAFVSALYATVKAVNPQVQVVISPGGDLERNSNTLYADVARWAREPGYVDVLLPQLYYGFENEKKPFEATALEWANLQYADGVSLCFGLAAYKCGQEDAYAGTGETEWTAHTDILARQVSYCRNLVRCDGFAFFTYSSIYQQNSEENVKKEWKNLKNMLQ
ncbi:MAG: family 10 glycosylhydrolase [Clostridia bacterium]|nr:family 10 glycosylhydrolase [Clostridia bacterium]